MKYLQFLVPTVLSNQACHDSTGGVPSHKSAILYTKSTRVIEKNCWIFYPVGGNNCNEGINPLQLKLRCLISCALQYHFQITVISVDVQSCPALPFRRTRSVVNQIRAFRLRVSSGCFLYDNDRLWKKGCVNICVETRSLTWDDRDRRDS